MTGKAPEILAPCQKAVWRSVDSAIWAPDSHRSRDDLRSLGLSLFEQPRRIDSRFLYDSKGSELFEQICDLPEYYLTRTEEAILREHAALIISTARVDCIVELGAGFSKKTAHLLEEQVSQRQGGVFASVDVSLTALIGSRDSVERQFPDLDFHGLYSGYEQGISSIEKDLSTLFVFLGSSIGNFDTGSFDQFLETLTACMGSGDYLLLGVDCVKRVDVLEAAYDDSQGVTAQFILNAFSHVNRLAGTNFDLENIRYGSHYDPRWQQVEMCGVARRDQRINLGGLEKEFLWAEGEPILVEMSRKFKPDQLLEQLEFYGLEPISRFSDPRKWFSLLLLRKSSSSPI